MKELTLRDFVKESNRIEGIERQPGNRQFALELTAHEEFLKHDIITVGRLCDFVTVVTGGCVHPARLRCHPGMNVIVGDHIAPEGGPEIEKRLAAILRNLPVLTPFQIHVEYECLHPFTDGNGRSGRVLWLWMKGGTAPIGFLHHFYYQTLMAAQAYL